MKGVNTTYMVAGVLVALGLGGGFVARTDAFQSSPPAVTASAEPCWRLLSNYDSSVEAARNLALNVRRLEAQGRDARAARAEAAQAQSSVSALRAAALKSSCDLPDGEFEANTKVGAVTARDVVAVRSF
jgi:hypothetical protein